LPYTSLSLSDGLAAAENTGPKLPAGLAAAVPEAAGLALADPDAAGSADAEAAGLAEAAALAAAADAAGLAALAGALLAGAAPPPQAESSRMPTRPRVVESSLAGLNMVNIVLQLASGYNVAFSLDAAARPRVA
jgi:hypothetical protein